MFCFVCCSVYSADGVTEHPEIKRARHGEYLFICAYVLCDMCSGHYNLIRPTDLTVFNLCLCYCSYRCDHQGCQEDLRWHRRVVSFETPQKWRTCKAEILHSGVVI